MLVRAKDLASSMSRYLIDRIAATSNINVLTRVEVSAVRGTGHLEQIAIRNIDTAEERTVDAAAMFIFIDSAPRSEMVASLVECDEKGFILTGTDLPRTNDRPRSWMLNRDPFLFETSVPGVFAVGDVRAGAYQRVAAAVGEGSAAIYSIHRYLETV